jgi:hypothetical protein
MSTYTELTYAEAEKFVEKNLNKGFYWDGWNIIKWTENPNGFNKKNGAFRNGKWGFIVRIPLQSSGTWKVLTKYV